MKFSLTKSFINNKVNQLLLVLAFTFISFSAGAQYCTTSYTSTTDEFITNVKLTDGTNILLNNNTWQPSTGVCSRYGDFTTSIPAINMSAGGTYTVTVSVGYCGTITTYNNQTLVWIDYNGNFAFEASEAVRATPYTAASGVRDISYTFTVPCNIKPGITRMRCRTIETTTMANPAAACGSFGWGEVEDYAINLQLPTSLSAGFAAPVSAWVKSSVKFINNNQAGYISHAWDADNNGTIENPNSINFNYIWNTPGTKCIKLKSTNCLGSDSIVKCLSINAPTVVPDANFVSDRVVVEELESVKLFDLSAFGPYQWTWKIYDSTDVNNVKDITSGDVTLVNPSTLGSQNPEFTFYAAGCYTVELVSRNDVGFSKPKVKKCYITVILPTKYYLGLGSYGPNSDNIVESATGTVMDNGGTGLYTNGHGWGTRSYLQITPCNASKIELKMTQLKFNGTGDVLRVWDGRTAGGANSVLLATWTSNSVLPKTVTATSGSMFILFESDNSGVDSGFIGTYKSTIGPAIVATPSFMASSTPCYNSSPAKFTNTTVGAVGVPAWEWTVDGDIVSTKRDLNYTFYSDQTYNVCLEIKSCVGKNKTCNSIDVITPNAVTSLDILASSRRPKINVDKVTLTPKSELANRFEWTIFPTTYTLLNPPASPSAYGTGYINYKATPGDTMPTPVVRFNASGCYTIALKAWNSLDSTRTTKTVVKNKYICALNYCAPSAFIAAADLNLSNVKLMENGKNLIDKTSVFGPITYTNNTNTDMASLTFGKTYELELTRKTNVDSANRKAWIDWNIDGDFDDNGEEILVEPSTTDKTVTKSFTVPNIKDAFEGITRLRVAINFNKDNTTPCGPSTAGEYHDYGITLYNDNSKPVITLTGNAIERIEQGSVYVDSGATAIDGSEGDLTSKIEVFNDLDVNTTGIYTYEYNVTDASGNKAETVTRTIIVVTDKTAPIITLNPASPGCIEAKRDNESYNDPGATASNTNPYYSLTSAIRTSGTVDTKQVGNYTIVYTVKDFAGNVATATRNVCVADKTAPEIKGTGSTNVQIGTLWVDQTYAEDWYDDNPTLTKTWYPEPLNPSQKGTYTVTYTAKDHSNNTSAPIVVDYRVDDFVPPVINLNTFDVVEHPVNTIYTSIQATVTDNYYGAGQVSISRISTNVEQNILGNYTETFKAVDGSNNVTIKTRTVKVVDKIVPVLWGGTIYGCVGQDIWPMWDLTTTDNYYGPQILLPLVEVVRQNVNPKEAGIYYITYKVKDPSNNTSVPLTRQVIYTYWPSCVNSTVGINDINVEKDAVSISPNPSTGLFRVNFNGLIVNNPKVQVMNAIGQLVMEKQYDATTSDINLDMTGYAKGIYSVNIICDGKVVSKKIVLQ